jgi:hypothetical protein
VAITVAVVDDVTLGAVNKPLPVIVPPLAAQVTPVFEVLLTLAVNCCVPADNTLVEFGETVTLTLADGFTVTDAWADLVLSATLVAVMVAVVDELTLGAVNTPSPEIVPPLALQLTPVFEVLLTVAANRWLPPASRLDEVGETATLTAVGGFTVIVA